MAPERRTQTRFDMNLPVKVYNKSGAEVVDVARAVNISSGGLRLDTTKFFEPDDTLAVKFLINSESSNMMAIQVIWSEDENGDCRFGAKFLNT